MDQRLTSEWTETLEEAYGEQGAYGREGELFVMRAISSWSGYSVIDLEDNKEKQVRGHDFLIGKSTWKGKYSVDCKNNIKTDNSFDIDTSENGWLFNPKKDSDRIWHCNSRTGYMAWYGREDMQNAIKFLDLYNTGLYTIKWKQPGFDFINYRIEKKCLNSTTQTGPLSTETSGQTS